MYCEQRGRALYEAIITAKISHEDFIDLVLLEVARKHHFFLANELNKPMAGNVLCIVESVLSQYAKHMRFELYYGAMNPEKVDDDFDIYDYPE